MTSTPKNRRLAPTKSKALTAQDILSLPPAPPGQRARDLPPNPDAMAPLAQSARQARALAEQFTRTSEGVLQHATNVGIPFTQPHDRDITALEVPNFWDNTPTLDDRIKDATRQALQEHPGLQGKISSRSGKRPAVGHEKWRKARTEMLGLLRKNKLPKSLRQTANLLSSKGFSYYSVQRAAQNSDLLRGHFPLKNVDNVPADNAGSLLDELSGTLARQFGNLPEETKTAIEKEWREGDKQKALDCLEILAGNPDAGSTGDVPLIEEADQDSRDGDRYG